MIHPLLKIDTIEEGNLNLPSTDQLKLASENIVLQFSYKITEKENEQIEVTTTSIYHYSNGDQRLKIMEYEVLFLLTVKDYVNVKKENDLYSMVKLSILQLIYSTIRGMLFIRTLGKPLQQFPLPVVNPNEFAKAVQNDANKTSLAES